MPDSSTCPTCNGRFSQVDSEKANPARPFCSNRCKLVDLSRWLGEEYRVAGPSTGDGFAPDQEFEDSDET